MRSRVRVLHSVALLRPQNHLRRIHAAGTGHIASFALAAQHYPLVNGFFPVAAETLCIGTGLFGTGKSRIDAENRTVFHANRAAYAMFVIHRRYSRHDAAAAYAEARANPWPQPFFRVSR